ncbi:MAG: alpha/beta hydrolase [Clostridia bacterium]|nr:alpha/beta hydrolase [Clostridia bacterium]
MKYIEYGNANHDTIIFLHGGGLSWWNYEDVANSLQNDYHIILPILDGHAKSDTAFTTIEENAKEIIAYIDAHHAGSILMIGGLSLGGQILLEILRPRKILCKSE